MCEWRPPGDLPWHIRDQLEGYKCPHDPDPGRDGGLCIFHIPLEEKNQNQELRDKFREEWWKLYDTGDWDFTGFEFPDEFKFYREEEGKPAACDFRRIEGEVENKDEENKQDPVIFTLATFGDRVNFLSATFGDGADFSEATFGDHADFNEATFGDGADFISATFGDSANFRSATFGDSAYFRHATFGYGAYFSDATFGYRADFISATFRYSADFSEATFGYSADFRYATFGDSASFSSATFGDGASFRSAPFGDRAYFRSATFGDSADFRAATFGDSADFRAATFGDSAYFRSATFGDRADFRAATFGDSATWSNAVFEGMVDFSYLKGRSLAYMVEAGPKGDDKEVTHQATYHSPEPSELIFESTRFQGPADFSRNDLSNTRFQLVDLSNISFLHSQISETKFISCKWGRGAEAGGFFHRKALPWLRLKRTRLLFDELIFRKKTKRCNGPKRRTLNELLCAWRYLFRGRYRDESDHEPIDDVGFRRWPFEDPSPGLIEVLALQLKQSLEATKDPIAAGDFHFCAMEMKRLRAAGEGRGARAKVLWWYKMLNGYGERYGRTLMWLGWLVAIFTGLYAWAGDFAPVDYTCRQISDAVAKGDPVPASPGIWDYLLYSFQNVLPFKFSQHFLTPCGGWARWLSFAETFMGTSLFAFFLLALRRRFKR